MYIPCTFSCSLINVRMSAHLCLEIVLSMEVDFNSDASHDGGLYYTSTATFETNLIHRSVGGS